MDKFQVINPRKDSPMKTYFSLKRFLKPCSSSNTPDKANKALLSPRDMLLADIEKTQYALETAYSGFDNVTDPDLIDCYIYEVNSALKRYRFLLQQAELMQDTGLEEDKALLQNKRAENEESPVYREKPQFFGEKRPFLPIRGSLFLRHNL